MHVTTLVKKNEDCRARESLSLSSHAFIGLRTLKSWSEKIATTRDDYCNNSNFYATVLLLSALKSTALINLWSDSLWLHAKRLIHTILYYRHSNPKAYDNVPTSS